MVKLRRFRRVLLASAGPLVMLPSANLVAQEGELSENQGLANARTLEEVVVSARKREESMQDVPAAVSVFSGKELLESGAMKIDAVGKAAPNVHFEAGGNTSGVKSPQVFIRGIGQADFIGVEDPSIGLYADEDEVDIRGSVTGTITVSSIADDAIGIAADDDDIERVEVLRGPQGTLFGANTIGGAINITSARPDDELGGHVKVTVGSDDHREFNGTINLPVSDRVATRISAFARERDGYVKALQYNDLELGNDDMWGLRGRIVADVTDSFTIDYSVDYSKAEETPGAMSSVGGLGVFDGELVPYAPPPVNTFAWVHNAARSGDPASCLTPTGQATNAACYGPVHSTGSPYATNSVYFDFDGNKIKPEQDLEVWGNSLTLGWDLGAIQLKSITSYREFDIAAWNDLDGSPHTVFHNSYEEFSQDQFSQELQLNGEAADGRLNYVVGLYYFDENVLELTTLQLSVGDPNNGNFVVLTERDIDNDSKAVFGQLNYDLSDSVTLTLGARWTESEKLLTIAQNRAEKEPCNRGDQACDVGDGEQTTEEFTPLASLTWNLSDDVMIYATYSEGYKNGGFGARYPAGLPDPIPSYDPEYVDSYELGMKANFFDGRMRLNAAAFTMDYEDMQVTATDPETSANVSKANLGEATVRGIEAEMTALLGEYFTVGVNLGLLDDEIDRLGTTGTLISSGIVVTEDNDLPYTPDWTLALMAKYERELSGGANISLRADYTVKDDYYDRIENIVETLHDDYRNLNLGTSYTTADGSWVASLGVINATDEDYYMSATPFAPLNYVWGMPVRPRTYQFSLQYNFGN